MLKEIGTKLYMCVSSVTVAMVEAALTSEVEHHHLESRTHFTVEEDRTMTHDHSTHWPINIHSTKKLVLETVCRNAFLKAQVANLVTSWMDLWHCPPECPLQHEQMATIWYFVLMPICSMYLWPSGRSHVNSSYHHSQWSTGGSGA